jgi:hypothetical protein
MGRHDNYISCIINSSYTALNVLPYYIKLTLTEISLNKCSIQDLVPTPCSTTTISMSVSTTACEIYSFSHPSILQYSFSQEDNHSFSHPSILHRYSFSQEDNHSFSTKYFWSLFHRYSFSQEDNHSFSHPSILIKL